MGGAVGRKRALDSEKSEFESSLLLMSGLGDINFSEP